MLRSLPTQAQAPSGITPEVMKQDILNFMNSMADTVSRAQMQAGGPNPLNTQRLGVFSSIQEEPLEYVEVGGGERGVGGNVHGLTLLYEQRPCVCLMIAEK